jgi:pimeloyl-ACP methyl ester carboxylesterase
MPHSFRVRALAYAGVLALGLGLTGGMLPASAQAGYDKTSAREKKRVDSVPTPKLKWHSCFEGYDCAEVSLPRDYDRPKGAKTELALLRYRSPDQTKRIGTLFVNPGGPGGWATELAYFAPEFLGSDILERFDIVGVDPRGVGYSDNVRCFADPGKQAPVMNALYGPGFPTTKAETASYLRAAKAQGRACATAGKPLSVSMSTAAVARDMDVLRRAVGDAKLSYLGFSYGSYLGQVYANLFPDRIRALALDGIVDPSAWRGSKATRNVPRWDRLRSADGSYKALRELLVRCDRAGGQKCTFALGDPVANFDTIYKRLKKQPLVMGDDEGNTSGYGHDDLVSDVRGTLYDPYGGYYLSDLLVQMLTLTEPPAADAAGTRRRAAERALATVRHRIAERAEVQDRPGAGFPYDSSLDGRVSITCTDGVQPDDVADTPTHVAKVAKRVSYFSELWAWNDAFCAKNAFSAQDEDHYRGSFTRRTVKPLLFVGNYWDPATRYENAVTAARLSPNSRLLSSDSWGHLAYRSSECVTSAVGAYLVRLKLPAEGKVCVGDAQPFTDAEEEEEADQLRVHQLVRQPN